MPRRNLAWLMGIAAFFIFGVVIAVEVPQGDEDYALFRLLVDVYREVDQRYEKPLSPEDKRKFMENAINGALEHLDPHSAYIAPREFKQLNDQTRGKFGGIGIQVEPSAKFPGLLTVVSPLPGTPAFRAGILAGDLIEKIDGKPTETMRSREAIELIKGREGEKIQLTLRREGENKAVEVEVVRAEIKVQSVLGDRRKPDHVEEWDYYVDADRKIAYLRLIQFTETTAAELRNVLAQLKSDGMRGLILDLRGNPGGLLVAAVDVSRMFISEGAIVTVKGRNHEEQPYLAEPEKLLLPGAQFPMAILIDHFSASASEIVSACLQDHQRAVIVGERSYGKGSVQNIIPLENRTSALKLTTARYWRPNGKNIHRDVDSKENDEWGVSPNQGFEVKSTEAEFREYLKHRRDRDVIHSKTQPATKSEGEKPAYVDRALQKALEYLRGEAGKKKVAEAPPGPEEA